MGPLTWEGFAAVAVTVFLLLVDLMYRRVRWAARYPPGPLPLPVLGNMLQLNFKDLPHSMAQLRRSFGDVFSLQMCWTPVVVVNGLKAVREVLVLRGEDTADRPPMPVYKHLGFGPQAQGVILARYGHAWREQRRFSLSTLRNFGLGKKSLEQWVIEEADCLCAAFATKDGCPFSPNTLLNKAGSNVIASLTHGRRFEYDDPTFLKLLVAVEEGLKEDSTFLRELLNACPVLLRIPGLASKVFSGLRAFMDLLDGLVTEHRESREPGQPPRDLTDAFLDQVDKVQAAARAWEWGLCTAPPVKQGLHQGGAVWAFPLFPLPLLTPLCSAQDQGNPESSFTDENLRMVVADLFSAGMVTTSTTLAWALLLMILHPDVQRRVQQEIDEVIGQEKRPELGDQARMPYTTAVVHEVQRFGDIIPLNVPHMTTRDTEVQGFIIPKGTVLFLNLSSVLKDERFWEKPFRFHPEHFLDAQGHFVKQEAFMPFSAGRRTCLGEPLARMELFLFFTRLLQRFSFSVPPGQPLPSDHGVYAFMVSPAPFQLCAVPR
ncbi:cytochrome P450 2D17-like isoform X2 [Tenrec ecaudatus]|uniref:cytochrome P450 2D17-like isoform X2 n=1 Tax=Tenrec ecaudatus TaxID=94439 RepID=UPI003F5998C6